MQHRHIDVEPGRWSIVVVDSILERGGASDVWALLDELRRDPFGEAACAAESAAATSEVYGYPQLIIACLEKWRRDRAAVRAGEGPAHSGDDSSVSR